MGLYIMVSSTPVFFFPMTLRSCPRVSTTRRPSTSTPRTSKFGAFTRVTISWSSSFQSLARLSVLSSWSCPNCLKLMGHSRFQIVWLLWDILFWMLFTRRLDIGWNLKIKLFVENSCTSSSLSLLLLALKGGHILVSLHFIIIVKISKDFSIQLSCLPSASIHQMLCSWLLAGVGNTNIRTEEIQSARGCFGSISWDTISSEVSRGCSTACGFLRFSRILCLRTVLTGI